MTAFRNGVLVALLSAAALVGTPGLAQVPADTGLREMGQRLQALQQQLDHLNSAPGAASRQRLMQQNWQGMQNYMAWMRDRWGVGYPWMMDDHGMGCPMMGGSTGSTWPVPPGMDPAHYGQEMRNVMRRMQEQMSAIAQSTDFQQRRRLLSDHWQTMYQHMQTMRGMGWMWAGPMGPGMMWQPMPGAGATSPLPEPGSTGATLVATYCTQCHAAPSPTFHTASEWASVTNRMQLHMTSGPAGIKIPSEEEMRTILAYMQRHAR